MPQSLSISDSYPEGSLYEDVITRRVWMLQNAITSLQGISILIPYEITNTGEVMEVKTSVFISSKRFKRVPADALVVNASGVFLHMDEELFQTTFGELDDYPIQQEASALGNVVNFTPRGVSGHTQEPVAVNSLDYHPLTRVSEMRDRLMEVVSCHRKILVESEALLATLTAFERDFKEQLGLPASDI